VVGGGGGGGKRREENVSLCKYIAGGAKKAVKESLLVRSLGVSEKVLGATVFALETYAKPEKEKRDPTGRKRERRLKEGHLAEAFLWGAEARAVATNFSGRGSAIARATFCRGQAYIHL
jgi:hypothetical protein